MQRSLRPNETGYIDQLQERAAELAAQLPGAKSRDWMSRGEAAQRLEVSTEVLRRWRIRGVGPAWFIRGNGQIAYRVSDLLAYEDMLREKVLQRQEDARRRMERQRPTTLARLKALRRSTRQKAERDV